MSQVKFNHIKLIAQKNPAKLAQFYCDIFNCQQVNSQIKTQTTYTLKQGIQNHQIFTIKLQLPNKNDTYLEIVQYKDQEIPENHNQIQSSICFQVEPKQFSYIQDRILKYGGKKAGNEYHETILGLGQIKSVYMIDIEENLVEIQAFQEEVSQIIQNKNKEGISVVDDIGFTTKVSVGKTGINQDSFFSKPVYRNSESQSMFAVFDGHGPYGHTVSQYVKEWLPQNIKGFLDKRDSDDIDIRSALNQGFLSTNENLFSKSNIDVQLSGSSGVLVYLKNNELFCANIGDSKAILCKDSAGKSRVQLLSLDHLPETHNELTRIQSMGGRVAASKNDPDGPKRIYFKDLEAPGVMMSRAFGDYLASSVGLIAQPDIMKFQLNPLDKYIVIASDGIWEFMTPQNVCDVVDQVYQNRHDRNNNAQKACEVLLKAAQQQWNEHSKGYTDDITVIVVFLKVDASYNEQQYQNQQQLQQSYAYQPKNADLQRQLQQKQQTNY